MNIISSAIYFVSSSTYMAVKITIIYSIGNLVFFQSSSIGRSLKNDIQHFIRNLCAPFQILPFHLLPRSCCNYQFWAGSLNNLSQVKPDTTFPQVLSTHFLNSLCPSDTAEQTLWENSLCTHTGKFWKYGGNWYLWVHSRSMGSWVKSGRYLIAPWTPPVWSFKLFS